MLPVIHASFQLPNSTGTFVYLGLEYLEAHNYPLTWLWTKDTIYHPNTTVQVIMPQKEVHSPDHYTAIYSDLQDKDARLFLHSASASTAPASSWQRFFLTNDIRVIYHDIPAYLGTFHVGPCLPAIPPSTRRRWANQLSLRCL
ncbi:Uncharacterized protein HZ326_14908 [Fusarium oxysporum f. sp. albedinis]|nr:Uncharacterized protein HZ326_14908 [Fusarium oxysporum f. sp. albedinis]